MKSTIEIGGIRIGDGEPVFVIAEAGVNHNGDPELALRIMDAARQTGVQCVKLQTFKSERVVARHAPKAAYQLLSTDPEESQLDMLRKLELPDEFYPKWIEYATRHNIVVMSTPYNIEDVDFLDDIGMPAFKLASLHVAEPYFLRYVAGKGKPMIVSTGMATLEEVRIAVETIKDAGNEDLVLLQCTTNYPSRIEDANLRAMSTLREAFDVLVGYSDHTVNDTACIGAVALGACVVEKHFTLDRSMEGPDHSTSADPHQFRQLVRHIREAESMLGDGVKAPTEAEKKNTEGMRRSLFTRRPIAKGEVISPDMLICKRPATGLAPKYFDAIVGRVARMDLDADQPLSLGAVDRPEGNKAEVVPV